MKRFLLSLLATSFLLAPTLASFSPELLEQISSELLREKTLRQDAEPVLHQLQSQYQHCASSHPKPEVRKTCQDFLNQQFPRLAQQWAGVQTGGFRIDFLGKLSAQERYARMGRNPHTPILLKAGDYLPTDKYEYSVITFPEWWFSFLIHALPSQYVQEEFPKNCEKEHKERPQIAFCPHDILIWKREQMKNKEMKIAPFVNQFGDTMHMRVRENPYPKGKDLKRLIQGRCREKYQYATEIYFDQQGKAYYRANKKDVDLVSNSNFTANNFTGLVLGYMGDTSHLTKRYLGLGRNLQAMVERGEREYVICEKEMYLRQTKNPEVYYTVSYMFQDLLIGSYFAVDINTPDGSSSFLTK